MTRNVVLNVEMLNILKELDGNTLLERNDKGINLEGEDLDGCQFSSSNIKWR
jgi:hypothetical protein